MTAGTPLTPLMIGTLSAETMRQWSKFLDDPNPIHLDPVAVAAIGLGNRVISQGPANLAYVINCIMANFPGQRIERLETRFADNVFAGDVARAEGTVTAVEGNRTHCEVWLEIEGRGRAIVCNATIVRD
jgi:acyl dehydratase